ncbi:MAG: GTPase ObgE [Bdellovibrionaceae bacterium]|nr:GTPase ObgE [Pseudobdellovibrionaceae bacterium]MBX3033598.1 GTPase ObgE [Pseudobdellovibrionaceae bacterium]
MKFIDEVRITVASAHGGPGGVSFRREAFAPRGGPDGGDGGKGGDVILRTSKHLNSLVDYKANKRYAAKEGEPGAAANCSGAAGADMVLLVPEGTLIRDDETGEILIDMTEISEHVLLKGGRGGKGNAFFKTSVNQAPEYAQPGEDGESLSIRLELKLIADVGIIGFPNAGKSTLISRVSAAKPKIADYPFTTLAPNLGVVRAAEYRSFVVADIPGLVKGAHQGVGLGIQFLRHIERTRLFIHLIDASGMSGRDPVQDYEDINFEIKMYDEANAGKDGFFPLSTRPQFVVFNKIDTLSADALNRLIAEFKKRTQATPVAISAVTGRGVKELIQEVAHRVFEDRKD